MNVKNLIKWLTTCLIAVVTLMSAAILYLSFAVDLNSYKTDIESVARQQGWDISIEGDLAGQVTLNRDIPTLLTGYRLNVRLVAV